ncbi:helix-turn-helix domain-containing protein [Bdellovibrio bacteriovorus]|uniref:helix-turn-helix domain-containing protein n=1 Tax=Bdellovibrio bacteriovorus TaxID=959 RepID=UPI0035A71B59
MSLTQSLRRILDDRKLTVAQLSRLSGVPAKTIYHWLAGQQPRKIEHLFRISDILNLSIEELYGRGKKESSAELAPTRLTEQINAGIFEVILRPYGKRQGEP